ncbi:hypothetical protein [Achromobacter aloeverae]
MDLDLFDLVSRSTPAAIHNVRLIDVRPADNGHELLCVEHNGVERKLHCPARWTEEFSGRSVGNYGYVVPAATQGNPLRDGWFFRPYIDQTLRRVPELDAHASALAADRRAQETVGWYCESKPTGFLAPVGIVPGEFGAFVKDDTVPVTVRVPPEFVRECRRVQMSPQEVLKSFIGDLAGLQNYVRCPRADGFGSNGSDERDYAEAWLQRAHGMNAIDIDELENREMEEEERQGDRDEFASYLDDYIDYGGNGAVLFEAVQALVDQQGKKQDCVDEHEGRVS